jgi:hypothetical protein
MIHFLKNRTMKKLYMPFIFILLLSNAFIVRGQISYYDYNPDKNLFYGTSSDVDFFKDAPPNDYLINLNYADISTGPGFSLRILPFTNLTEVMVRNDSLVKVLTTGDLIDENQTTWTSHLQNWMPMSYVGSTNTYGDWINVTGYIGMRMYKNGDYYYGYVQMTVQTGASQPLVTINDQAYQKTPGKGIKAGQMVGINDENTDLVKYFMHNRQLFIQIVKPVNVSITDISGHQLLSLDVKQNRTIDLSAFVNGIYLIRITGDDGIIVKKIVLQ